jgi:hypothetical protein
MRRNGDEANTSVVRDEEGIHNSTRFGFVSRQLGLHDDPPVDHVPVVRLDVHAREPRSEKIGEAGRMGMLGVIEVSWRE